MRLAALAAALVWLAASPASAELRLTGEAVQGGLLLGEAEPGSRVSLDGRALRVSGDGRFLVGFDRDHGGEAVLEMVAPSGTAERRTIAVGRRDWQVQRIDGLPPAKVTPDATALERIRAEAERLREVRRADSPHAGFAGGFMPPAEGRISGIFGSQRILNGEARAPHSGVDIAAPAGAAVVAAADGIVVLAHPDMFFTGLTVVIDHGHGLSSVYAHLQDMTVTEGQTVGRGERIGSVGASGRATGPHLHWGVSLFETRLDPEAALQVLGGRK